LDSPIVIAIISIFLVLGNFFFVAAEYALIGTRRAKIEQRARKGERRAKAVLFALDNLSPFVAATQVAITMLGIAMGSVTEPFVRGELEKLLGSVNPAFSFVLSYFLITFVLVVVGELLPKYLTIKYPEGFALFTAIPLNYLRLILKPLVWLVQTSASGLARLMGIDTSQVDRGGVQKEELMVLIRAGQSDLEDTHAGFIERALRLDDLTAREVMIHRTDIRFLDVDTPREQLIGRLGSLPHTRLPVCRGDIDDLVGVAYLHDIVKHIEDPGFTLEKIAREPIIVPENLTLDKAVSMMREQRTQILMVVDEYGGTAGLITLEDVVEEIFGELEDKVEADRPLVETHPSGRISARGDLRFDELLRHLDIDLDDEPETNTLGQMFQDRLGRVPKIGDQIDTVIGKMRVENMARRRVTRVSLKLRQPEPAPE
jgi:putative hemolysin